MAHSYKWHLRKAGLLPPKGQPRPTSPSHQPPRFALFHMPAIRALDEAADTRLVGFRSYRDQEWIEEMSTNYYILTRGRGPLTTFFPDHP